MRVDRRLQYGLSKPDVTSKVLETVIQKKNKEFVQNHKFSVLIEI